LIKAGDYLIVPIAQKHSDEYSLSESQREKSRLNSRKSDRKVIHTIVSGDSLWLIARKYKVTINSLIKWNHLKRSEPLKLGKKLLVWQSKSIAKKDLSLITTLGINIDRKVSYRVKNGDNLSVIADKFGVTVLQIKRWNQLDNKPLQPGQKLTIMVNIMNTNMK
jgi:membrane-bound lytic murein transglycosylase D